ncbi:MAG TPA: protein disulfide oxidoreductase [Gallionella sp.]|jgi:thiol-disulfide isomerase/thioredoxin|nr:MAG: alkyl hydroperoxide reductase [Gallionellales bacterium GWA2_54_124]OGT20554.1 MAG: alkyl hydroperoxide reductase [Gallionellales bacterium RIFOXYD12_FULL_53_10]HCI53932.1 protein disulfide oxidoreductase [Gallionella sp.]
MVNKRALSLLLFVVVIAGIRLWQQRDMVSGAAPGLQGVTVSGQPYRLPAHPGHPVLVHFWASWCSVCRAEQDSIAAFAHDDPNVITVAMQSGSPEQVVAHMREQGINFPVVNDPDGRISRAWGVHAVPASFIIAPDGTISFVEVGYTTQIGLAIRRWLAGL